MNAPSTTAQNAGIWGMVAAVLMGLVSVYFPEHYDRVPPGFEAAVAGIMAFVGAWISREKRYKMTKRDLV